MNNAVVSNLWNAGIWDISGGYFQTNLYATLLRNVQPWTSLQLKQTFKSRYLEQVIFGALYALINTTLRIWFHCVAIGYIWCHLSLECANKRRLKPWARDLWAPASTSHWPALGAACAGQCLLAPRSKERNCLHIPPHLLELFVYVRACEVRRTRQLLMSVECCHWSSNERTTSSFICIRKCIQNICTNFCQ